MDRLVIVLPLPPKVLSPNARPRTWHAKNKATGRYRHAACLATQLANHPRRQWQHVTAQATFYWPAPARRDVLNAEASLKAAYDGIVDAGLIPDDSYEILRHLPAKFDIDPRRPRVEITITSIEGDTSDR